jgi:hypothetical protein
MTEPRDAARFTIRYESPASSGTIDGRLMSDDTVQPKVIPAPTTAPAGGRGNERPGP